MDIIATYIEGTTISVSMVENNSPKMIDIAKGLNNGLPIVAIGIMWNARSHAANHGYSHLSGIEMMSRL